MTGRSRVRFGGVALAALVALTAAGCAGGDTTADRPDASPATDAILTDVVFDVHRDPG